MEKQKDISDSGSTLCSVALLEVVQEFVDGLISKSGREEAKSSVLHIFRDNDCPFFGWYGYLSKNGKEIATNTVWRDFDILNATDTQYFEQEATKYYERSTAWPL